jgi:hypothetical protein
MEENTQNQNQPQPQPQTTAAPTPTASSSATDVAANQPSSKNTKKKVSIVIIVSTLLILLLVTIIFFRTNSLQKKASDTPDLDTFYTAEVNGEPVLFFKVADMNMNEMYQSKYTPYSGVAIPYKNGNTAKYSMGNNVDFRKLKNSKKTFTFQKFATIESLMLSTDKTKMIFSFSGGQNDNMSYIYQVDLANNKSQKIWEHQIYTGDSPYNGGMPHIIAYVPDAYVAFEFLKGDIPPATLPSGVVVKNIKSGAEKSIGIVGDVKIDTDKKVVTYKKYDKVKLPCDKPKDPKCFTTDTYKIGYGTVGSNESQPLP